MWRKVFIGLQVAALLSAVLGGWALALNQFASFLDNGKRAGLADLEREVAETQLAFLESQAEARTVQERAAEECLAFGAPRAIVVGGETYCVVLYFGSEQIASLRYLKERYGDGQQQ